ncbi:hypothetical protein RND81_07G127900 [Saponaria officinalis]|uniref:NADH-plastoquinone oxidoreductase subunit 5 n=1 Tax=Saponaria officinalis TaxID=3572 RepID=A0AAW1JRZ0_SAPOF
MKRSGTLAIRMTLESLARITFSGTTAGSISSIGGTAILNIFRYLSFTGGRILDHIYNLANKSGLLYRSKGCGDCSDLTWLYLEGPRSSISSLELLKEFTA